MHLIFISLKLILYFMLTSQPDLFPSLYLQPYLAILGLRVTPLTLTGTDLDPHMYTEVPAWTWPLSMKVPDAWG